MGLGLGNVFLAWGGCGVMGSKPHTGVFWLGLQRGSVAAVCAAVEQGQQPAPGR